MSKFIDPEMGCWIVKCDWEENEIPCSLGQDGSPRMFVDPDGGKNPEKHFQCGEHHGIVKQEDNPEFQLPDGEELNEDILTVDPERQ
jgi:hypothetical protein